MFFLEAEIVDNILQLDVLKNMRQIKSYADMFQALITLCMKLSWFGHTNSGQLFCNCPLFVIALIPGLFLVGNQMRHIVIGLLLLQNG